MKYETESPQTFQIQTDADGCLYDQSARHFLSGYGHLPAVEAISAIRAAARQLHLLQERWAETQGLSEGRMQLLFMLMKHKDQPLSLGTLAEWMRVSPRNITGLVDNLERAGLVERVPDPADRRSVRARLTPAGRERIEAVWKPAVAAQATLTDGFTEMELVQLRHLCLKLLANGQRLDKERGIDADR